MPVAPIQKGGRFAAAVVLSKNPFIDASCPVQDKRDFIDAS
jgi:hypothetical protein